MYFKSTIYYLFFLMSTFAMAQNTISGKVVDAQNQALPYVNVILHQTNGESIPKGAISDDNGQYLFDDIANGTYRIEVSSLGFKTHKTETFDLNSNQTFNFTLEEETQALNEVVIKAKRPVIKQTAEKLVVDIEKSNMVNSNLQDVITRVPGIIVTNNGINFAGRSDVRILINGKTTDYMDINTILRDLPADNIARVELVEQPGAEFDAEGSGPIINIILKKNVQLGTHGNVTGWMGEDNGFEYGGSAFIASYKNKLNWQLGAGYSSPTWREDLYIKRQVLTGMYTQDTEEPYNPRSLRFNGNMDYYINDKHSVGIGLRRITTDSDRTSDSETIIEDIGVMNNLLSKNSFDRERTIFNVNPFYEFKTDKQKLVADFNFVDYQNDNINDLFKVGGNQDFVNRRYIQDGTYQIKTYKVDYSRTFSEAISLSLGAKHSNVETDSDLKSFLEINDTFEFQDDESNRFMVDEDITALYSKLNATKGKWSFSGGLRYEYSKTVGTATSTGDSRSRKISKLFPSASISRELSEHFGASVSYSYRIRRPNYNTLNTFATYYDPYSAETGNPNLKPAFTNNYQFNLTYDGQPFFTVAYNNTKDALFQLITQDDATAQIQRSMINLAQRYNWNFRLFAPLNLMKGMEGFTGVIVDYNKFESENLSPELRLKKWNLTWFTQISYELPWDIDMELSGFYGTGALEGQIEVDWVADLDFSFSKRFLEERLKVNLGFNNMINRAFNGKIEHGNINADVISNQSRYNVQLRVGYSFGSKFGKNKNRRNASGEEEDRIDDNN